jgi:hypothetical protein
MSLGLAFDLPCKGAPIMAWPPSQHYNEALEYPRDSFRDAKLLAREGAVNALGLPMPSMPGHSWHSKKGKAATWPS